jgi:chromosome segregation protein
VRLKSLEIKGFKSFADKTVVNFDENITGIVGPNGCGKSNIVDSIRWVIGEQKISHLRSENLESLVFNGSKTRSASGLAEVSLTFENTQRTSFLRSSIQSPSPVNIIKTAKVSTG